MKSSRNSYIKTCKNIKKLRHEHAEVAVELLRVVAAVVVIVATGGRSTASCAIVAAAVLARAGLALIAVVQDDEIRLGATTAATLVAREELCLLGVNAALALLLLPRVVAGLTSPARTPAWPEGRR